MDKKDSERFLEYSQYIGLIEKDDQNILKSKLSKIINLKSRLEQLSDSKLERVDFYTEILLDYVGGLPKEFLK